MASYRDRLWVARGDEIAAWWRQREAVEIEQRWVDNALLVRLKTPAAVRGLSVFVTLPYKDATLRVDTTAEAKAIRVKPMDPYRAALVFDTVQPGTTLFRVTFD